MNSLEAMDHIDRMFLSISESVWLPQWSFDFWIIPYLLGKGITVEQFREFMLRAHKRLALEIASVADNQKKVMQQKLFQGILEHARNWKLNSSSSQMLAA
jgi:p-methyltransferase